MLEAKFGLFHVFGAPRDADALTRDLGVRYLLPEVSLKPYPCGIVIHPLIDACLAIAKTGALSRPTCAAITASVHPRAIELAGRQHPQDAIAGRYSLQHAAALALTRRSAGLAAFDEADVNDPGLVAMRSRMTVEGDPQLAPSAGARRRRARQWRPPRGSDRASERQPRAAARRAQLRAKFMELATRAVEKPAAEKLYESASA